MCRPTTKSGIAPKVICAPWVFPETEPATVWPLPMPAALIARRSAPFPAEPLEVGVELGDLHSGLGEDDVAALRGRIGGIEVPLADVVATVQQLGVHQPAVGDVDLRQRPARADREDALAGVARLADQPVEGLAGVAEHVEPGEQGAVRADVVDVDDLGDRSLCA